jgi:hypothetical protein
VRGASGGGTGIQRDCMSLCMLARYSLPLDS